MDLSKIISLIAEVAVKKLAREREGSSDQTTPEAVPWIVRRTLAFGQRTIRMGVCPLV